MDLTRFSQLSEDNQNNVLSTLNRLPIDNFYLLRQLAYFENIFPIVRNSSFAEIGNALAEARETIMYTEMYPDDPRLEEDRRFVQSLRRIRDPRRLIPNLYEPFLNTIMKWAILHGVIQFNRGQIPRLRQGPISDIF